MKHLLTSILFCCSWAMLSAQEIRCTVYNDLDSLPLPNIQIELFLNKRRSEEFVMMNRTDSSGVVVFKGLENDHYKVVVKDPDFEYDAAYIELKQNNYDKNNFYLHYSTKKKKEVMGDMVVSLQELTKIYRDSMGDTKALNTSDPSESDLQRVKIEVSKFIAYPQIAIEEGIQGKVYVGILCNAQFEILKLAVMKSVDVDLDTEALYALYRMKRIPLQHYEPDPYLILRLPLNFKML
jgi:hypothetical protein